MNNKNNQTNFCRECSVRGIGRPNYHKDYSNLTPEAKQYYADILNYIFKGTIGIVRANQITPNAARAGDFFMEEIFRCAQAMKAALNIFAPKLVVNMVFDICIGNGKGNKKPSISQLIVENITSNTISTLLTAIYDHFIYKTCINKVNVNWKSQMGLLLGGIIDDLPY